MLRRGFPKRSAKLETLQRITAIFANALQARPGRSVPSSNRPITGPHCNDRRSAGDHFTSNNPAGRSPAGHTLADAPAAPVYFVYIEERCANFPCRIAQLDSMKP
jgi:hypothetical protein